MRRWGCSAGVPAASVRAGVLGTPLCPLSPLPADALAERAFLAAGGHHLSPASSPLPSLGLEAVGCRDMSGDGAHWWEGVNHHGPGCSRTAMGDGWAAGGEMMPRSPIPRMGLVLVRPHPSPAPCHTSSSAPITLPTTGGTAWSAGLSSGSRSHACARGYAASSTTPSRDAVLACGARACTPSDQKVQP